MTLKWEALRWRDLNTDMFADIMQGSCVLAKLQFLQVYTTDTGWIGVSPMKAENETPETLDLIHRDFNVPKILVPDKAKKLI
jgi:hypothetical protein